MSTAPCNQMPSTSPVVTTDMPADNPKGEGGNGKLVLPVAMAMCRESFEAMCDNGKTVTKDGMAKVGGKIPLDTIMSRSEIMVADVEDLETRVGHLGKDSGDTWEEVGDHKKDTGDLWMKVGDLRKDTGDLMMRVGHQETDTGELQVHVGNLEKDTLELQARVGNLEKDTGELQARVGILEKANEKLHFQSDNLSVQIGNLETHTRNLRTRIRNEATRSRNLRMQMERNRCEFHDQIEGFGESIDRSLKRIPDLIGELSERPHNIQINKSVLEDELKRSMQRIAQAFNGKAATEDDAHFETCLAIEPQELVTEMRLMQLTCCSNMLWRRGD